MKNLAITFILVVLGLVCFELDAADQKAKSDKQRIELLEQEVQALRDDLAGEHQWANNVNEDIGVLNERTLDLNSRLQRVENRGPVAGNIR